MEQFLRGFLECLATDDEVGNQEQEQFLPHLKVRDFAHHDGDHQQCCRRDDLDQSLFVFFFHISFLLDSSLRSE